jgi:very-short-patch-repair endonuclease
MLDSTQRPDIDDPIDMLRLGSNGGRPRGVRVHRTNTITRKDIRCRKGIPVTSPALTILRLAAEMDDLDLETVLLAGFRRRLVRRPELDDVMQRNPHAKGIGTLRALLAQAESLRDTRSRYERKLLKLLEAAELPRPLTNTLVAGKIVDAVWPDLRLIIEFDGWQDHGKRKGFETDRLRDQHLLIAGHDVMRVTFRQIDYRPHALIARIASVQTMLRLKAETATAVIAKDAAPVPAD